MERRHSCLRVLLCALLSALCALACHRETRSIVASASEAQRVVPIREGNNQPGAKLLARTALKNPYEGNAYAISQGQQLFDQQNCSGCHSHGGGNIGPPLMDDEWIYGSSPANIYESISEGRPNGMPSFGGHLDDYQIWQLVTYVRSLSNLEPQNATPARADAMQAKKAEE